LQLKVCLSVELIAKLKSVDTQSEVNFQLESLALTQMRMTSNEITEKKTLKILKSYGKGVEMNK